MFVRTVTSAIKVLSKAPVTQVSSAILVLLQLEIQVKFAHLEVIAPQDVPCQLVVLLVITMAV